MGRPKQLTPPKEVFHVRLPEDRTNALKSEADTRGGSPSEVIRLHLDRYAEIAWRDLPSLSDNTWCAIFEALGAVAPVPVDVAAVASIATAVTRVLEQSELGRKWKVDAREIIAEVRGWTFGQACAVADAAARFHRALAQGSPDALQAARQATTRPAALVLEPPTKLARSATRTKHR
jgi:hypothetical protein